ncbi:YfcE family phosphodiesterase [Vibrio cholerae]|uniref:phosphodiesterase n=1 Tax=Vibrio cholerae TaxID=666 RepID=UPI000893285E|nr:phosphodiesterase [Vibrio cholerae]EGR4183434.1 phosphodiesterase [Vibrio cholerae]OFJ35567.1 YfcE family phosphodiesterase [Vibrio cholerae]
MKLFFVSDLHGSLPATEQALALYQASGAQSLILLGDVLNHGPRNPIPQGYNPVAVAEKLNQFAQQIIAVRGNCDSEVDQMLLSFPMMSDSAWVLLSSGRRLFLTHGHFYHKDKLPPLSDGDVLVHGHTHIPMAEQVGSIYLVNPGSMTFPRSDYAASYGVLEGDTMKVISVAGETLASCLLQ